MSAPTHEDAMVLLKLYELGNNPVHGKAWDFVFSDDFVDDYQAFIKKYPKSSEEYGHVFTFAAWFELMGALWKHKLLNQDLLFDWILVPPRWNRVAKFMDGYRKETGNKSFFEHFEAMAKAAS
jgi:hypothetical protein